jgi:hypothetical protein
LAPFVASLDPTEQAGVYEAIADRTIQAAAITRWLKNRGYKNGVQVIDRHRREGCRTCRVKL